MPIWLLPHISAHGELPFVLDIPILINPDCIYGQGVFSSWTPIRGTTTLQNNRDTPKS